MAVPAPPTATHEADGQETPFRAWVVPVGPAFQVEPSVVTRASPAATTATPEDAEVQAIPLRPLVVPLVCGVQVWPPLVVPRMVPAAPATKQVEALGHDTPFICCVVPPPACVAQWAPPSVVAMVTPCLPVA